MKFLVVVLVVCASLVAANVLSKEERTKKLQAFARKCQENEKGSETDYEEVIAHELPSTEVGKCVRACLMESFGVLQGLTLDLDAIEAVTAKKTADPALLTASKEIAAECAPLSVDSDRCAVADKFIRCSVDKLKARGYDPKKVYDQE